MQELPVFNQSRSGSQQSKFKGSRYNHFVKQEDDTRLVYNSVTNAMSTMDEEAWGRYQEFRKGEYPKPEVELDQHLVEGGYIVPEGLDEIAHLKHMHLASRFDNTSWSMTICPTIACNFGCDYCFEVHKPGKMSAAVQSAILTMLEERAPRLQTFSVTWYGGEPTLAWDVVQTLSHEIIRICNNHGITYEAAMISNGYLLDEQRVNELEELHISRVQITLDGNAEYHDTRRVLLSGEGSFDRIIENLKHFVGSQAAASIRVNVDSRNQSGVHELIDSLATAGLAGQENIGIYFAAITSTTEPSHGVVNQCLSQKGFSQLEVDYLQYAMACGMTGAPFPSLNFAGCIAIRPEEYVVQADGEVHKCWNTVGQSQYAVGHLLDPARNPLKSPEYTRWLNYDAFSGGLACNTCTWLPTCMGGCPFHAVYHEVEANPGDGVYLECTSFKFNHKKTLPMFARSAEQGDAPSALSDFCSS